MAVVDSSIYTAIINVNDVFHSRCIEWLRAVRKQQASLYAPVIIMSEVAAATSRGQGDPQLALQVVRSLRNSRWIELAPISETLAFQAAQIAAQHRIRGCDALYVALAQQLGETLVTLDRQQLTRGAAVVVTLEP